MVGRSRRFIQRGHREGSEGTGIPAELGCRKGLGKGSSGQRGGPARGQYILVRILNNANYGKSAIVGVN